MVDLKIFFRGASGAPAILPEENRGYVVGREGAAISGLASAPIVNADFIEFAHPLRVGCLPAEKHLTNFLAICLRPALYIAAVLLWVLAAALACLRRVIVVWIAGVPFSTSTDATFGAHAVGHPSPVVSVDAGCSGRVVHLAALSGGGARRMPRLLGLTGPGAGGCADGARIVVDVALGYMSVLARFSGEVALFAGRYRSGAFRARGGHTLTLICLA